MQNDSKAERPEAVSDAWVRQARQELVGRVVKSSSFAKSERLSSLLIHVCDRALSGRENELNEQRIGQAVFGRAVDYDSSIDGIVRTQASRLRQRLEIYFNEEGAQESLRIEIPKGGYIPHFVPVSGSVAMQPVLAPDIPSLPPSRVSSFGSAVSLAGVLPWVLCAILALACIGLALRRNSTTMAASPPHPLWSTLFVPGRSTLAVPADSGLVISYSFTQQAVTLDNYLSGHYRSTPAKRPGSLHDREEMNVLASDLAGRRYTSFVDLEIAAELEKLAEAQGSSLQIRYARDLRPNDLKNGDAILIGASEANPWVALFEPRMNFVFSNAYGSKVFSILNRAPRAGEPDRWDSALSDPMKRVYGVIALLPNLSGNGHVLLIEGTSMAGSEAAWDFVSDDTRLLPLLKQLRHHDGTLPGFEILVGTQNMEASAVHSEVLAWRTHD